MSIRRIVTVPEPVLREKAKAIRQITPAIETLIDDLIETMREAPGVGLAAPQVGVGIQVIVVEYAEGSENSDEEADAEPKPPKLYAVVNPEITRHSKETELGNEGCLSIPEYMGEVERYSTVTVKGLDRHGKSFKLKTKGWMARIFQHEIDHLNGVLFIDRTEKIWKPEPEEEQEASETV
ncbi:MAG: peptide deformylase [Anaerolineales bacterium]